jgi:hypothetical protein
MWQHCTQTRVAVTFLDVRAVPDMGKREGLGCSEEITTGGCTTVCQLLMSGLPLTAVSNSNVYFMRT